MPIDILHDTSHLVTMLSWQLTFFLEVCNATHIVPSCQTSVFSSNLHLDTSPHLDYNVNSYSTLYVLQKHRVFCQLPNGDWALCTVLTTSGDESVLKVSEGKVSCRFLSKIVCSIINGSMIVWPPALPFLRYWDWKQRVFNLQILKFLMEWMILCS